MTTTTGADAADRNGAGRLTLPPRRGRARRASARRSSCFAGCPSATTRCPRRSASGRTRAGAARSSTRSRPRAGERVLDVATGTGMVAAELLARAPTARSSGIDQSAEMLAARPRALRRRPDGARVELDRGRRPSALPFADASFDALTFTYLLRYVDDPPRDDARARARRHARAAASPRSSSACRRGAPARAGVAPLHGRRAAGARAPGLARVGRGRALPRPEHPRLLRAPSAASGSSATGARPGSRTSACGA